MMATALSKKCVVVGDPGVGKTCLILSYATNEFPTEYTPTKCNDYVITRMIDNKPFNLNLFDTAGQGGYERLRTVSYPQTDVFLICFGVDMPVSFQNVRRNWLPEIRHHCPSALYLIVGTRMDTRDGPSVRDKMSEQDLAVIQTEDGEKMAAELGAVEYVECSALTRSKLEDVFNKVIEASLKPSVTKQEKCLLL
ncbi:P-loop containing nucleoside triphosphate hydrolase protein [Fusarium avenaceum]|nr:P-loop containing nucleoside triphosphate hydrolase protein [Fusarium avenaceum]